MVDVDSSLRRQREVSHAPLLVLKVVAIFVQCLAQLSLLMAGAFLTAGMFPESSLQWVETGASIEEVRAVGAFGSLGLVLFSVCLTVLSGWVSKRADRRSLAARAVPLRADLAAADDRSRATSSAPSEQMTRDQYKASRIGILLDVVIRLGSGAVVAYAVTQLGQPTGAVRTAVWLLAVWVILVAFDAIWRNRWSPAEKAALRQDAELKQQLSSHLKALDASPKRGAQYVSLSDLERILDERGVRRRKPWWKARSRRAR